MEFGDFRRAAVERYCCNVICGAPAFVKVKGLREREGERDREVYCLRQKSLPTIINDCITIKVWMDVYRPVIMTLSF